MWLVMICLIVNSNNCVERHGKKGIIIWNKYVKNKNESEYGCAMNVILIARSLINKLHLFKRSTCGGIKSVLHASHILVLGGCNAFKL